MRTFAVAHRVLLQFIHDKRTLGLLFIAPLVVLWLLSVLLGAGTYEPRIATVSLPEMYQQTLNKQYAHIQDVSADEAERLLRDDQVDAVLSMSNDHILEIWAEGSDSTKTAAVSAVASKALASMQNEVSFTMKKDIAKQNDAMEKLFNRLQTQAAAAAPGSPAPKLPTINVDPTSYLPIKQIYTTYLHGGKGWKMFDFYGPVFIGIFLFVFTFITSGMSLVTERSAGTMSRFLATPVNPVQILGGYALGFGALSAIQVSVILTVALQFIGFPNEGNIVLVGLIAVSLTLVSVTLGLLVSGLASNAFQVIQLILLFVVPQILLCGLFDLSTAPAWMQLLSRCLPLTYGVDALRDVMLRGAGFGSISVDLTFIWVCLALFFALACLGFRKKSARRMAWRSPAAAPFTLGKKREGARQ